MNSEPAPATSMEEMSLNRLWAASKLPLLSFNNLAVSGCTLAVPQADHLGQWLARRQLRCGSSNSRPRETGGSPGRDRRRARREVASGWSYPDRGAEARAPPRRAVPQLSTTRADAPAVRSP